MLNGDENWKRKEEASTYDGPEIVNFIKFDPSTDIKINVPSRHFDQPYELCVTWGKRKAGEKFKLYHFNAHWIDSQYYLIASLSFWANMCKQEFTLSTETIMTLPGEQDGINFKDGGKRYRIGFKVEEDKIITLTIPQYEFEEVEKGTLVTRIHNLLRLMDIMNAS